MDGYAAGAANSSRLLYRREQVSIHSSFRTAGGSSKHRNVLTRLERLEKLEAANRWDTAAQGLFGLPKVKSIKVAIKKKKKKDEEAGAGEAAK